MATTYIKPLHRNSGISFALGNSLDYIKNKIKTNSGELVEGYMCQPQTAQNEFLLSKKIYAQKTGRDQGKHDVIAYHIRMSFKPGDVTAEKALELGRELAMRWTKGKHQFIIAAHTNTDNPHVHIVYNSVTLDCDRKYQDFLHSYKALRRLSDLICLEHGLTIIENPAHSKGYNRAEYLHEKNGGDGSVKPPTARDQLREIIDAQMMKVMKAHGVIVGGKIANKIFPQDSKSAFDSFIVAMKNVGCEVKRGKHLAFKLLNGQRFIRCKSLGDDYDEVALLERISGIRNFATEEKISVPHDVQVEFATEEFSSQTEQEPEEKISQTPIPQQTPPTKIPPPTPRIEKPNLLIDIQAKLQKAHSPGFEHFARLYNLKEMAKTLIFLSERGIDSYDALVEKSNTISGAHNKRSNRIKEIEAKLSEISELQKQIGTYGKTKDTYLMYRKMKNETQSAWAKFRNQEHPADLFYESNRANITLHEAAKKYFDAQGYGASKKIPTIKSLQMEYAKLNAEKKKLWAGYRAEREEMVALKMAKQNCDTFLGEPREPQKTKSHEHSL